MLDDDRKPKIEERYRSAINTSNMGVDERTYRSASDVVGAMGLADKHLTEGWVTTGPGKGYDIKESPLSAPLQRLLSGDNRASHEIVRILAEMLWKRAEGQNTKPKIIRPIATDIARACLGWFRHGTCKACGGHGFEMIKNTPIKSACECQSCKGKGKMPLERSLDPDHEHPEYRALGIWLASEMERALGRAGPAAMAAIAPKLDL